jgi:hypothetical protein
LTCFFTDPKVTLKEVREMNLKSWELEKNQRKQGFEAQTPNRQSVDNNWEKERGPFERNHQQLMDDPRALLRMTARPV